MPRTAAAAAARPSQSILEDGAGRRVTAVAGQSDLAAPTHAADRPDTSRARLVPPTMEWRRQLAGAFRARRGTRPSDPSRERPRAETGRRPRISYRRSGARA